MEQGRSWRLHNNLRKPLIKALLSGHLGRLRKPKADPARQSLPLFTASLLDKLSNGAHHDNDLGDIMANGRPHTEDQTISLALS